MRRCGIALLALATLSTISCGRQRDRHALEKQVSTAVGQAVGQAGVATQCDDTAPTTCHVGMGGASRIDVAVKRGAGGVAQWTVAGTLVATAPVVAYLDGELEDLGVGAHAHCGAALRVIPSGERMPCLIAATGTLFALPIAMAWVTTRASGPIDVEVAYGPSALAARWNDADDAALTAISAHLADGSSVNDDVDEAGDPAGLEPADGDGASP